MFLKLLYIGRKFYSSHNLSKSVNMNYNRCYFRYIKEEDKVDITFILKIKDSARQFNFKRSSTECLENLIRRIETNVQKVVNKVKKKKTLEEGDTVQVKFIDDKKENIALNTSCLELFSFQNPVHLQIYDTYYNILFNSPWVLSVTLPQILLAGFPVYPENYLTQYTDFKKSVFNWYKGSPLNEKGNEISDIHIKWTLVGRDFNYTPDIKDIGSKLKLECIPGNADSIGPAVETIAKSVVEAGPGKCPFEARHMFTTTKLSHDRFRCVSYNILADLYCDSDHTRTVLYPYCPPYALHLDYRKLLLLKELEGYNADILCLQEVDQKVFSHVLSPILGNAGLEGVFYKKGKEVAEGLACFYRKDRFSCIGQEKIFLAEEMKSKQYLEFIWNAMKENTELTEKFLDRSNVSSATVLQSNSNPNEILLVGNTHLYYHPDGDCIRLLQGSVTIYWLNELLKKLEKENPDKRISIILCGDFNSVPSCGIYELYTTGRTTDCLSNPTDPVQYVTLDQNALLASACGTPTYTNFTADFADCLDYIYYNPRNLKVEQVVPFPSDEELKQFTALPSIVCPSDHIALIADLKFV